VAVGAGGHRLTRREEQRKSWTPDRARHDKPGAMRA
jgi:hypothetical protein